MIFQRYLNNKKNAKKALRFSFPAQLFFLIFPIAVVGVDLPHPRASTVHTLAANAFTISIYKYIQRPRSHLAIKCNCFSTGVTTTTTRHTPGHFITRFVTLYNFSIRAHTVPLFIINNARTPPEFP